MFLTFFLATCYRSASLYHPQRRAILHLKNQKRKIKDKNKLDDKPPFIDFSTLKSKTVRILLLSTGVSAFGINTPIFHLVSVFPFKVNLLKDVHLLFYLLILANNLPLKSHYLPSLFEKYFILHMMVTWNYSIPVLTFDYVYWKMGFKNVSKIEKSRFCIFITTLQLWSMYNILISERTTILPSIHRLIVYNGRIEHIIYLYYIYFLGIFEWVIFKCFYFDLLCWLFVICASHM